MLTVTDAERALLTADNVAFSAGLELLDSSNRLVEDISGDLARDEYGDLVDGAIDYDNYATVHGSCRLSVTRRLTWGRDRVRPYALVSDGVTTLRYNQGVYVLTTPSEKRGETPQTFDVTGYNLLHLLQDGPGDTYVVTAGTTYVQAVRDVVTASGIGAPLMIDGTLQDTTLPADRVWALADTDVSWLRIIDDLFEEINYDNIWADRDGNLRSGPYQDPSVRPVDYELDTADEGTNIVGQDRVVSENVANVVNWWKFVRADLPYQPVEGDGIYTVENVSDGPASQDALGRVIRRVVRLEAADQAALVAQGDRIVTEDKQVTRTVNLTIEPLPIMGHGDVFQLSDDGTVEKLPASSWSLSLTGDQGQLTLGGARKPTPERGEQQASATVTQATSHADGLRIVMDGATVDCPAKALQVEDDAGVLRDPTYNIGQRVTCVVRSPTIPLVQGVETTT